MVLLRPQGHWLVKKLAARTKGFLCAHETRAVLTNLYYPSDILEIPTTENGLCAYFYWVLH